MQYEIDKTQVIVVAGGKAKRMGIDIPKCLLEISGKKLIDRTIESLTKEGFKQFVFLVGHKHELVMEHIGDGSKYGIQAEFSIDPIGNVDWGKGKAIKQALKSHKFDRTKRSLILFPDDVVLEKDIFSRFLKSHLDSVIHRSCIGSIVLVPGTEYPYGEASVDPNGLILGFKEKPLIHKPTSIGIYIFEPAVYEIIEYAIDLEDIDAVELESGVLPILANERKLSGFFIASSKWIPINTLKEYEKVIKVLEK